LAHRVIVVGVEALARRKAAVHEALFFFDRRYGLGRFRLCILNDLGRRRIRRC
jgi:hypothetical protein